MKYCRYCGTQLRDEDRFCCNCGGNCDGDYVAPHSDVKKDNLADAITSRINSLAGGTGAVRPPLSKVFGSVFKKHSRDEAEEIFVCGTANTTPRLTDADVAWPHPWLFSRILLAFAAAFLMLHFCCKEFENLNAYPGLMVVGSFTTPLALMMFFFELNSPRNISFFTVIKVFLVGGCASLLVTLLLFEIFPVGELDYGGAILVGIIEEVGKLIIVAWFIFRNKDWRHPVNGLLVGAVVGAGFAAFESAGYAFRVLLLGGYDAMMDVIFLRAVLAPGGHVVWAAMSGYAIMIVKGQQRLDFSFLGKSGFWKLFWIPVTLHAIWDMPIEFGSEIYLMQILLTLAGWVVIFVLISNSLTHIGEYIRLHSQCQEQALPESENCGG